MSDLIGENNLLKDLVSALTKENDSRNKERAVLNSQLDRLTFENAQLQKKLGNIPSLQSENSRLQMLLRQLEDKAKVKNQVVLTQSNLKRQTELENKILELERKERTLGQQHKSELQLVEKKWKNKVEEGCIKIREMEKKIETSELSFKSAENSKSDFFKLELKIKEKDEKIKYLEENKTQILNKMRNLQVELSQKQIAISNLKEKERQAGRLDDLLLRKDEEIKRLNNLITILKQNLLRAEQNSKEKQIERQEMEVENNRMKELINEDVHIHREEVNRLQTKYELEIKRLNGTIEKLEYEREMDNENIENEEIMQMRKENEYLNRLISTLKEDNRNIKQTAHYQKQRLQELEQHSSLHSQHEDKDLKEMVFELKKELTEMKSSYVKMHFENEKMHSAINEHIAQKDLPFQSSPRSQIYQSEMNMGEHFMGRKSKLTPSRLSENYEWSMKSEKYDGKRAEMPSTFTLGKNAVVGKKSQNQSVNREKWEALQRKINMLREQNDELKKTLFD